MGHEGRGLLNREDGAAENLVGQSVQCEDIQKVRALAGSYGRIQRPHVRGSHLSAVNGCGYRDDWDIVGAVSSGMDLNGS